MDGNLTTNRATGRRSLNRLCGLLPHWPRRVCGAANRLTLICRNAGIELERTARSRAV